MDNEPLQSLGISHPCHELFNRLAALDEWHIMKRPHDIRRKRIGQRRVLSKHRADDGLTLTAHWKAVKESIRVLVENLCNALVLSESHERPRHDQTDCQGVLDS